MKTLMRYPHALVLIVALSQTACDIKVASDNQIASNNSVPVSLLGGTSSVNNYTPRSIGSMGTMSMVPQSAIEDQQRRVTMTLQSMKGEPEQVPVTVASIPESSATVTRLPAAVASTALAGGQPAETVANASR